MFSSSLFSLGAPAPAPSAFGTSTAAPAPAPVPSNPTDAAIESLVKAAEQFKGDNRSYKLIGELISVAESHKKEELVQESPGPGLPPVSKYVATYNDYDFKRLSYAIRDQPTGRPPNITPDEWADPESGYGTDQVPARVDTIDSIDVPLTPYAIEGFEGIQTRLKGIEEEVKAYDKLANGYVNVLTALDRCANENLIRVQKAKDVQRQLMNRLLRISLKIDINIGYQKAETKAEAVNRANMMELHSVLLQQDNFQGAIDEVVARVRMHVDAHRGNDYSNGQGSSSNEEDVTQADIARVLEKLQQLSRTVSAVTKDVDRRERHLDVASVELDSIEKEQHISSPSTYYK